jgi:hypothetical protein
MTDTPRVLRARDFGHARGNRSLAVAALCQEYAFVGATMIPKQSRDRKGAVVGAQMRLEKHPIELRALSAFIRVYRRTN